MVKAQRPETRLEYYMKDFPNFAGLVEYSAFSMNDLREVLIADLNIFLTVRNTSHAASVLVWSSLVW